MVSVFRINWAHLSTNKIFGVQVGHSSSSQKQSRGRLVGGKHMTSNSEFLFIIVSPSHVTSFKLGPSFGFFLKKLFGV